MAEIFLLIGSCLIVASLLWRRISSRVKRYRDSHRMESTIAEYLSKAASEKIT